MKPHLLTAALLALLLLPTASADEISGYSTIIQVRDQDKHNAPADSDVTFIRYGFEFSGSAPRPNALNAADRIGYAWVLLNVDHQYHDGYFSRWTATTDNEILYRVHFNGFVIEYRTELHVEDSFWTIFWPFDGQDWSPIWDADHWSRGHVRIHYLVFDHTGNLVADETEEKRINSISLESIPDSRLWIIFENNTLIVQPDFMAFGLEPRLFQKLPLNTAGRVTIENVTYERLELEISSTKSLEDVSLAYGFGKPGHVPGYTFGSLAGDVIRTVAGAIGTLAAEVFEWLLLFIPGGSKLIVVKEYVVLITEALWEILATDLILFMRVLIILVLGYGLLLFIDPMFALLFRPLWWLLKAFWTIITFLWELATRAFEAISGRLSGGT